MWSERTPCFHTRSRAASWSRCKASLGRIRGMWLAKWSCEPRPRLPMLGFVWYVGLQTIGVPHLVRRLRKAGVILCYHNVKPLVSLAPPGDPGVHLSLERFAEQVRWLARNYAVVTLHELVDRLVAGRPLR